MGDLFHEDVPNSYIQAVFTVMARCWQHTFQILTKRPSRILEIISIWVNNGLTLREGFGAVLPPNVWLGVSVENQKTSEERIPLLLQTPAAVRFVSAEPLLGNIYLNHLEYEAISEIDSLRGTHGLIRPHSGKCNKLDWVIVGAESGPRRRECDNQWIARIVKQCVDSNTPVFVKQAHEGRKVVKMPKIMGRVWDGMP
jgi:protein gp37